ncbi:MAG: nuclear transport factor 2 family protein [Bdellovibrionota bacterium]
MTNSNQHPNAQVLEKIYAHFVKGEIPAMLALCDDKIKFDVPGKSKLAGKYTKETFEAGFAAKHRELSGGDVKLEVHDIMASDRHGVALLSSTITRNGKPEVVRGAHVWRFENGKPVAWYDYAKDLYQYDSIWS